MTATEKIKAFGVRKIVLLAIILVLLIVLVCQICIKATNGGYKLTLKGDIDTITIQKGGSSPIKLINSSGTWILVEQKNDESTNDEIIAANADFVKQMTDYFAKTEIIGKVSNKGDDEKFGFGDQSLFVSAEKDGKVLRKFEFGKDSITNAQTYAKVDDKAEVVLAGGNPRAVFDKTHDQLKANLPPIE